MTGTAKAILVFGGSAVLTDVEARAHRPDQAAGAGSAGSLEVIGPVSLDAEALDHVRSVVLGVVNAILLRLGLPACSFKLSFRNVDVSSAQELGTVVTGFSADFAIFVAMLFAALGIPSRANMAYMGSIASMDGRAAQVASVAEKLDAARSAHSVEVVVLATPNRDHSVSTWAPAEEERTRQAILACRGRPEIVMVDDVADVVACAFAPDQIVPASLRQRFFLPKTPACDDPSPIQRAAEHLLSGNPARFWTALQEHLQEGRSRQVRLLLADFVDFHLHIGAYPSGFGNDLWGALQALPLAIRRRFTTTPLLPIRACFELGLLAGDADQADAVVLVEVVGSHGPSGQVCGRRAPKAKDRKDRWRRAVEHVLEEIGNDCLTRKFTLPLSSAVNSFIVKRPICGSHDEFMDLVAAFYRHVARHSGLLVLPANVEVAETKAIHLVEEAFGDAGGLKAAEVEARTGANGGARLVLGRMEAHLHQELRYMHIDRVIKEVADPLGSREKEDFVRALIGHLGDFLPEDIQCRPVQDFVEHRDLLVRAVAQLRDRAAETFRGI